MNTLSNVYNLSVYFIIIFIEWYIEFMLSSECYEALFQVGLLKTCI